MSESEYFRPARNIDEAAILELMQRQNQLIEHLSAQIRNLNQTLAGFTRPSPVPSELAPAGIPDTNIVEALNDIKREIILSRGAGYWLLPHTDALDYFFVMQSNVPLLPGETREFYRQPGAGWLIYATMVTTSPNFRVISLFTSSTGSVIESDATAAELNTSGYIGYNSGTLWLNKFDDINKIYTMSYTPTPWLPFNSLVIKVKNEDSKTATIVSISLCDILIKKLPEREVTSR